jgi:hypothetical protein
MGSLIFRRVSSVPPDRSPVFNNIVVDGMTGAERIRNGVTLVYLGDK